MKILMFSGDAKILDENSATARRMGEYGKRVEKLDILLLTPHLEVKPPSGVGLAENVGVRAFAGRFLRFPKAFFRAWRMLAREKYDLLVAQDIEHAKMCWLLSLRFGTPWQMQIHADIFSPYFARHSFFNRMRAMLAKFLIPRASCVRVVSERIKKSLLRTCNVRNTPDIACPDITVLPILTEPADLNAEPKRFPEFEKTILVVSRLASEKNIILAIEAMVEVVKKYPKVGLVIIGEGPERKELEQKAKSYKLTANIKFEGWVEDPARYYKGADIFLLTSWYEGWGMSAVEAMRYGAAVIMTDVGLAGELVKDGESGLVAPVGDKNALILAIFRLLENDGLRRILVEEASKKIQGLPSAEEYYQEVVKLWTKCVS